MKKYFTLILLFICLLTSACSSDKKESDLYSDIIEKGTITVGVKEDAKPFGFRDKKGEMQGFDIDLAKYIAKSLFMMNQKSSLFQ